MDFWFVTGFIIIMILILGYLMIIIYLYWYQNPKISDNNRSTQLTQSAQSNDHPSTVTYTRLGKRGDMGNQIFQLAAVIAAGNRSEAKVVLPPSIDTLPINQLFDFSAFPRVSIQPDRTFYEYDNYECITIPADGSTYDIRGYRQVYHYFEDIADTIRTIFTPRAEMLNIVKSMLPERYLAVHIRKGDYVSTHNISLLRGFKQCELDFYKQGIQKLRTWYPDLPVLVCTDSPQCITPFLSELDPLATLAPTDPKRIAPKFSDFCTLYLADGIVISNSTYSWWAAYLRNNRPIICPTPWWDPGGFIGTGIGLNGPYLHHPEWWLLDADTGAIKRTPYSSEGNQPDTNGDTLHLYRMIRGMFT